MCYKYKSMTFTWGTQKEIYMIYDSINSKFINKFDYVIHGVQHYW